jgi:kojibiose phosphorylase
MSAPATASTWQIAESGFRPELLRHYEGAFTLGSAALHVRGSLEEHLSGAPQNETYWRLPGNVTSEAFRAKLSEWGTFVPGVYGPHPLLNNQLINLPWFLEIAPVVDGERLDLAAGEVSSHERVLDMRSACLTRRTVWRTRSGATVTIEMDRFVSAARARLCVQRVMLTADRDIDLVFAAGIDADVRTNGFEHFQSVQAGGCAGGRRLWCDVRTDAGDAVRIVSESSLTPDSGATWAADQSRRGRAAGLTAHRRVRAGDALAFEKRTAAATSRDGSGWETAADGVIDGVAGLTWQQLLDEHRAAWEARWAQADVEIEGDDESQRAMRFSIYHLLRCQHAAEDALAIDAKGYAGQAYWGRFFWDSEVYLLPFYAHTTGASFLTRYRIASLEGARRNAAKYGLPGAKYAWEADAGGDECCPNWQYADHEIHISADVAYALAHEARARGAPDVDDAAAEAMVEIARFWLARLTWREDDRAHILGVMGPDEYTFLKDDNAFTNRMAARALDAAATVGARGGATAAELAQFRRAAEAVVVLRDEQTGVVLQCAGFDQLADPLFESRWKDHTRTFAAQVPQEWLYRTKCLKQADVLMLPFLFEREWSDEQVRAAWQRYLPWTTHDSSLSAGVHGILACRLARAGVAGMDDEAWRFWRMSRDIDVEPAQRGCEQGIHIASAAALWQMVVYGFAGVGSAMWHDALTVRPRLPAAWNFLKFSIRWRGCSARVEIRRGQERATHRVRIECMDGVGELAVSVGGEERRLCAGERVELFA